MGSKYGTEYEDNVMDVDFDEEIDENDAWCVFIV